MCASQRRDCWTSSRSARCRSVAIASSNSQPVTYQHRNFSCAQAALSACSWQASAWSGKRRLQHSRQVHLLCASPRSLQLLSCFPCLADDGKVCPVLRTIAQRCNFNPVTVHCPLWLQFAPAPGSAPSERAVGMTAAHLRGELVTLMLAGHETSAHTLTCASSICNCILSGLVCTQLGVVRAVSASAASAARAARG